MIQWKIDSYKMRKVVHDLCRSGPVWPIQTSTGIGLEKIWPVASLTQWFAY